LLTIVAEESNRLIRLVNSLLDLSRLEAGMVPFHFTEYDLPPLINRTLDELTPLANPGHPAREGYRRGPACRHG